MNNYGEKQRSKALIVVAWLTSFASLVLVYAAANAMVNDLLSFRSCSTNSSGLVVLNCGKQAITIGDVLIGVLLLLSIVLSVSLFTGAWRASRRRKK